MANLGAGRRLATLLPWRMREPSPHTSRLAIVAGLGAAMLLAGAGFLAGRSSAPLSEATATGPPPEALSPPAPKTVEAPLDREAILSLARRAEDATASNAELPAELIRVAGKRFDLVIPFGCDGPSDPKSSASMRWSYDSETETLRITVVPDRWTTKEWRIGDSPDGPTEMRGFWIARPWSSATTCVEPRGPQTIAGIDATVLPGQTLAIASLIEFEDASKARPLKIVRRVAAEDFDPTQGFRLRVVGRIVPPAGANPIHCIEPGGREQRPLCLMAASFGEFRIESPTDGTVFGAWPIGGDVHGED